MFWCIVIGESDRFLDGGRFDYDALCDGHPDDVDPCQRVSLLVNLFLDRSRFLWRDIHRYQDDL